MSGAADPVKLAQLVEELYAKKQWLDKVISSLEAAVDSPDYRLIAALSDAFENGGKSIPKVDLHALQQGKIENLAAAVSRRRNGKSSRISVTSEIDLNGEIDASAQLGEQHDLKQD